MSDWHSYDEIAERYDRLWCSRFEAVARYIWAVVLDKETDAVLDIGTGTAIVPKMRPRVSKTPGLIVGCDPSTGMLRRARLQVPELQVVTADATALPFRDETFDMATASFVLSHISNYPLGLAEVLRVLKPSGTFAVSNWKPPADPYIPAWNEYLSEAISSSEVERAVGSVTPWETHFTAPGNLEAALIEAGFSIRSSHTVELEFTSTVDQFIEDRELSAAGRFGRHFLGCDAWNRFRTAVAQRLMTRFGSNLQCRRGAFVVVAGKSH